MVILWLYLYPHFFLPMQLQFCLDKLPIKENIVDVHRILIQVSLKADNTKKKHLNKFIKKHINGDNGVF